VGRLSLRFAALGYLALILIGPLAMMVLRTLEDLDGAWAAISDPNTIAAFKLTLLIVRGDVPGRGFLNAFVDLPLSLSPVIVGFSLVTLYGLNGWFGWFQRNGYEILFATPSIVLATIFVTLPFVVREVVPTLREIGTEQEQAAQTLGASGWQTFWRITLPSIRWAVVYGVVLTAARAIGEYGAVALVSGNIAGETQTATLRVEDAYQFAYGNYAPAYGISFVLAATAILILILMIVVQPKGTRH
jgi:sulfate transport system permease protein